MDILDNYQVLKAQLKEISKSLLELFNSNDELKIIKNESISRIDIIENRSDASIVDLEFYSFKDPTVLFTFNAKRIDVLEYNESNLLKMWYENCLSLIERNNIATAKKFLKSFSPNDYAIVYSIIAKHKEHDNKTNDEIAKNVAMDVTTILKNQIKEKLCAI